VIIIDAGILIAVASNLDRFHLAATAALREEKAKGSQLVLPTSAYSEALVWPIRQGTLDRVDRFLDRTPVRLAVIDREIARTAARFRAARARLRLPDALVLATAHVLRAERVLTTDSQWPRVEVPVTVLKP
jgi:predicted nucleic acid-binding protein